MGFLEDIKDKWYLALVVILVAAIGSFVTFRGLRSDKYKDRELSVYQPSPWVFSVVWTFIYITYWYVWMNLDNQLPTYLKIMFYLNMGLNLAWTVAFFGFFSYNISFIIILALALLTLAQVFLVYRLRIPGSGLHMFLMLIYLSWLSVASILNFNFVDF